jgi:hypothetical protein
MRHRGSALRLAVLLACAIAAPALAQEHVGVWYGYGAGAFLSGGGGESTNSNQLGGAPVSIAGDRLRLRYLRGSFERPKRFLPTHGDNDADYRGADLVLTGALTHWPFAIAVGYDRHEQAFLDQGGQGFVHRWGPHLAVFREQEIVRHLVLHGELDVLHVAYRPAETFAVADLGLGVRF